MDSREAVAPPVDYDMKAYMAPQYKLSRVFMQSGGTSVTMTSAGGNESIFEIPAKVFNLSRSYLRGQIQLTAGLATHVPIFECDTPCIYRDIQIYTKGGLYLVNVPFVNNFLKMALPWNIRADDFLTIEGPNTIGNGTKPGQAAGNIAVTYFGLWQGIFPSRKPITANYRYGYNFSQATTDGTIATGGLLSTGVDPREPQYFLVPELQPLTYKVANAGALSTIIKPLMIASTDGATTANINFRFPLSIFKETLMSIDKDLFFDETIYLRVVYENYTRCGFYTAGVISGDQPANTVVADFNTTIVLNAPVIASIDMLLAVEQNEMLIQRIINQKRTSGISLLMPYVYMNKISPASSTSQIVTLKFNRSHGIRLLRIYNSIFNITETNAGGTRVVFAFDNSNWSAPVTANSSLSVGSKWTSFYTMLDNVRRQEYDLTSANYDDYTFLQDKIKGSSIFNSSQFVHNSVWLEDFSDCVSPSKSCVDGILRSNLVTGLDLSQEHKWDFFATVVAAQYNIYTFSVALRILNITPQGVLIQ